MGKYIKPIVICYRSPFIEISTDPEVKLQVRGESYYLTTLRETDIPALHAILSEPSVNNRLFRVPKPYTSPSLSHHDPALPTNKLTSTVDTPSKWQQNGP